MGAAGPPGVVVVVAMVASEGVMGEGIDRREGCAAPARDAAVVVALVGWL